MSKSDNSGNDISLEDAACDFCGKQSWSLSLERGDGLRVVECDGCGLAYLNPRPPERSLAIRYETDYATENLDANWSDYLAFRPADDVIRRIKRQRGIEGITALDVGCGQGFFLHALRCAGAGRLVGIDPGREKIKHASGKLPEAELIAGRFEDLGVLAPGIRPSSFDLVAAIDLIEHLYSPGRFFEFASQYLRPGGLLYLETPNWGAARKYGSSWEGLNRDYEHIHYFTAGTVSGYLAKHGFRPLGFDYNPVAAGLGSTRCLASEKVSRPSKDFVHSVRRIVKGTPGINREVYRLLQISRRLRNYSDIRNATAHSLIVTAAKEST